MYNGLIAMWMLMLCQKPSLSLWHAKNCLEGQCLECGINTFKVVQESSNLILIEWKSVGYEVVGKTNEGRNKKA